MMSSKIGVGRFIIGAGVAVSLGVAAAVEPVGEVARLEGLVVVSQGAKYVTATEGMALRAGDRLMALESGSVTVRFVDGCLLNLADNTLFTVGPVSSCASEAVGSYGVNPNSGVANAPNAKGYLRHAALEPPTPPALPPPMAAAPAAGMGWLLPAAAAGGIVALIAANDDDDDDDDGPPISQ
jgi:hypothetical protein